VDFKNIKRYFDEKAESKTAAISLDVTKKVKIIMTGFSIKLLVFPFVFSMYTGIYSKIIYPLTSNVGLGLLSNPDEKTFALLPIFLALLAFGLFGLKIVLKKTNSLIDKLVYKIFKTNKDVLYEEGNQDYIDNEDIIYLSKHISKEEMRAILKEKSLLEYSNVTQALENMSKMNNVKIIPEYSFTNEKLEIYLNSLYSENVGK